MQVQLTRPELARFVAEKVKAGEFASPDAVIEDALVRMMQDEDAALGDADVAEIDAADAEFERGEVVEFDSFAAQMRQRYAKP